MSSNVRYNFKEAQLGPDFAQDALKDFKQLIDSGVSFVTHSMPGVGASYFLKYLANQNFAFFIYIDLYELPSLTQHEFYRMFLSDLGGKPASKTDEQVFLEAKEIIKKLTQEHEKIVIIFSRFDQLKKEFDENFLSNLQALTTISPGKIVLIFTAIKPLYELAPEAVTGGNLNFYSRSLYFKPYSKKDLRKLLKIDPEQRTSEENFERLLELSGGHNQLLHIFLNSQKQQNLLLDQFVRLQLKELVDYLDYQQRKQIQKMASNASHPAPSGAGSMDEYLLGVGMVKKFDHGFKLFSPLFEEYIKSYLAPRLPQKEYKLFKILKQNLGKVVSKDDLFQTLWEDDPEKGTDWALDALIYRLRKHPFMKSQGYIIESYKKVGYSLIQT